MGSTRSLEKLRQNNGKTAVPRHWEAWSSKFNWVERALKYDEMLASRQITATSSMVFDKEIQEYRTRAIALYQIAFDQASSLAQLLTPQIQSMISDPALKLSPNEIGRLVTSMAGVMAHALDGNARYIGIEAIAQNLQGKVIEKDDDQSQS